MEIITKEQLIREIERVGANEKIDLKGTNFNYNYIVFDKHDEGFSWSMERSWENTRNVGYVFPMKGSQYIKMFKTLNGAKSNLIKNYVESEWSWVKV